MHPCVSTVAAPHNPPPPRCSFRRSPSPPLPMSCQDQFLDARAVYVREPAHPRVSTVSATRNPPGSCQALSFPALVNVALLIGTSARACACLQLRVSTSTIEATHIPPVFISGPLLPSPRQRRRSPRARCLHVRRRRSAGVYILIYIYT